MRINEQRILDREIELLDIQLKNKQISHYHYGMAVRDLLRQFETDLQNYKPYDGVI